ncbi:hypothetical protein [Tychonema sp. LEGE 07203]|uniref:hypothetical protein n=1 Tax=Tychonema sp. LEGE 07203 TaxID=1828671 RepID=UPI001D13540F|nr:hypothetical protein [Tychonema sp. LEGE 07203]
MSYLIWYSMKLNYFAKLLSTVGRWMAATVLCLGAMAFVWQGGFLSNTAAMASPAVNSIAAADIGDGMQEKASKDAGRTKNFIQDAEEKVKETAKTNAAKVDRASDNSSFVERKAKEDAATIEKRAEEDSARTQEAVDNTKNAIERAVDSIKDAFN